eukprot:446990_1
MKTQQLMIPTHVPKRREKASKEVKDQKNAIKQEIYRNYVSKMNNRIKALNEKKMNWSDCHLLKKYECIKLFNNVQMMHCGAQHINAKSIGGEHIGASEGVEEGKKSA